MPLIKCSECGQNISDQAPSCPHCGYVFKQEPVSQRISINEAQNVNIEKIVKTGKIWKQLILTAWIGGVISFIMAITSLPGSAFKSFAWLLVVAFIILFFVAKISNWMERG